MRITTRQLGILRFLKQRGECTPYNIVNETDLFRNIHYPRCVKDLENLKKDNLVKKRQEFSDRTRKHVNRNWWSVTDRGLDVLESHVGKEIDPEPKLRQLLQVVVAPNTIYGIASQLYKPPITGNDCNKIKERLRIRIERGFIQQIDMGTEPLIKHYVITQKGLDRLNQYQL